MKEIKATVQLGTGEEVPENQIEAFNARNTKATTDYYAQQRAKPPQPTCPLSSAVNPVCRPDCALRVPAGCCLKYIVGTAPKNSTAGKRCPLNGQACTPSCALFEKKGCIMTAL